MVAARPDGERLGRPQQGLRRGSLPRDGHCRRSHSNDSTLTPFGVWQTDWQNADGSWVNATSAGTVPPGGSITRSFRIILAGERLPPRTDRASFPSSIRLTANCGLSFLEGGVRQKAAALRAAGRPVLVSVPGYVVAADMTTATLFLQPPAKATLASAYVVNDGTGPGVGPGDPPCMSVGAPAAPNAKGWVVLPLTPTTPHCRCRVELRYSDGSYQVASYYVLPGLDKHLATFGAFQASTAFCEFGNGMFCSLPLVVITWRRCDCRRRRHGPVRPLAVDHAVEPQGSACLSCLSHAFHTFLMPFMPWNRKAKAHVLHDPRNFIVGLSDEGGAGANVGFASKQRYAPVAEEVAALDRYINSTLWG